MSESLRMPVDLIPGIKQQLVKASTAGLIKSVPPGDYVDVAYSGVDDGLIPATWNVQIYYPRSNRPRTAAVVCVDAAVLEQLCTGKYDALQPSNRQPISIDDAGWGFPLLGVLVGVSDGTQVLWREVPVVFFRGGIGADSKEYLAEYARQGLELIDMLGATPATHRVEICTGYINTALREELRGRGWEVRVAEIGGLLQDQLEEHYRQYVLAKLGKDLYYDPKAIPAEEIPKRYAAAVTHGRQYCPQLLKTMWKALSDPRRQQRRRFN